MEGVKRTPFACEVMFVWKRIKLMHIPCIVIGTNVNDVKLVVLQIPVTVTCG